MVLYSSIPPRTVSVANGKVYTVLVSVGVAHVKVPSPSERRYCAVVPFPVTFSSLALTTFAAIWVATELVQLAVPSTETPTVPVTSPVSVTVAVLLVFHWFVTG